MILQYDPNGLGIIEQFGMLGLDDLLPGLMPTEDDAGDEWDEDYIGIDHLSN